MRIEGKVVRNKMKKKEMKKKLLAGVMGILMVGAMSTVAFAEEGSTTVQHTKASP
ncbi:MAG: hypothetical protein RR472_05640 [Anaerovoracaceae bacterium]